MRRAERAKRLVKGLFKHTTLVIWICIVLVINRRRRGVDNLRRVVLLSEGDWLVFGDFRKFLLSVGILRLIVNEWLRLDLVVEGHRLYLHGVLLAKLGIGNR